MDWLNAAAGLLVGLLVGFTGVGGGALMTPVLVFLVGVAPQTAVGTDLVFAALTKLAGAGIHGARQSIDWQVVRRLAWGSLPAALATLAWLAHFPRDAGAEALILKALGAALLLTAMAMLFKPRLHALGRRLRSEVPVPFKRAQPALTVVAGAVLGTLVTLTSIGAGALGAVMLVYLYPYRLTPARLVGTDIVHAIPLALVAGAGHLWLGNIDFELLTELLAGSIPGVMAGAWLSSRARDTVLRPAIALVLLAVGARLVLPA